MQTVADPARFGAIKPFVWDLARLGWQYSQEKQALSWQRWLAVAVDRWVENGSRIIEVSEALFKAIAMSRLSGGEFLSESRLHLDGAVFIFPLGCVRHHELGDINQILVSLTRGGRTHYEKVGGCELAIPDDTVVSAATVLNDKGKLVSISGRFNLEHSGASFIEEPPATRYPLDGCSYLEIKDLCVRVGIRLLLLVNSYWWMLERRPEIFPIGTPKAFSPKIPPEVFGRELVAEKQAREPGTGGPEWMLTIAKPGEDGSLEVSFDQLISSSPAPPPLSRKHGGFFGKLFGRSDF